jgi:hypothetical protein
MIRPEPPEPTFRKALFVTLLFVLPIAWFTHFMIRMPAWMYLAIVALVALAAAAVIHVRVKDDWRSRWRTNFAVSDRSSNVARNIRIIRK